MTMTAADRMDRMYRHQRHIYDLTRKFYLLGRDRAIARLGPPAGASVLEIGCGTGRNLIAAARRYPRARFFGIDISSEMLATARAAIVRAGLTTRISVHRADATSFDPKKLMGEDAFDRVLLSYSLSMIPNWRVALYQAALVLADNGQLHIADFGGQEQMPELFRSALRRWLELFDVTPRVTLNHEVTALASRMGAKVEVVRLYFGYCQLLSIVP